MSALPKPIGCLVESEGNVITVTSDHEEQVRAVIIALSRKYACCHYSPIKRNEDGHFAVTIHVKETANG
jgi:hypothetical protein